MSMHKSISWCITALLLVNLSDAQAPSDYTVPVIKKTYNKISNPFIKRNVPIEALVIKGNVYIEGDIFLGTAANLDAQESRVQVQAVVTDENPNNARWERGIIPFEIREGFDAGEVAVIISAINHIASRTNVCFIRKTDQQNYIKFVKYTVDELGFEGGSSYLGRCMFCLDGQEVKLSVVTNRIVRHEISHALGLLHEQVREDRDNFVKILVRNIEEGHESQFDQSIYSSRDVGTYDFNSIMHYQSDAFGKKRKGVKQQTIERRSDSSDRSFGRASSLSEGDINGINRMYPTERVCPVLTVMSPGELSVDQSITVSIYANKEYNKTGIFMREGQKFRFSTASQAWNNGSRETDCDGYTPVLTDALRRYSNNMMALVGELFRQNNTSNYTGKSVRIGCGKTWTATGTGYLMAFANDMFGGYGDNSRLIELTVTRTE